MSAGEAREVDHQGYRWEYAAALRRLADDAAQLAGEITAGAPIQPPPRNRWNAADSWYQTARASRP